MRVGVVGDVHWCSYSSIVRSFGKKYTTRLENLIESVNWAEKTLAGCDLIVYLGDFFDRSDLNSQEITALKELKWNSSTHIFLLGNHEIYSNSKDGFNSLYSLTLQNYGNFVLVDRPMYIYELCFLPYGKYDSKLDDIFPRDLRKHIVFSHNDLKGFNYGGYTTTDGIDISDINNSCRLFVNGHLHNHYDTGNILINLGNLTGQNFSEDAEKYKHYVMVLDTDTYQVNYFTNSHALNFYKFNLMYDVDPLKMIDGNAVVSITTTDSLKDLVRDSVNNNKKIIESRIVTLSTNNGSFYQDNNKNSDIGSPKHFYNFLVDSGVKIPLDFVSEVLL